MQRAADGGRTQAAANQRSAPAAGRTGATAVGAGAGIYQKHFADQPEGRAYLAGRGIPTRACGERHGGGYCNGRLPELLPNDERVRGELKTLGLLCAGRAGTVRRLRGLSIRDARGAQHARYTDERCAARDHAEGKSPPVFAGPADGPVEHGGVARCHAHVILVESVLDGLSVELAGSAQRRGRAGHQRLERRRRSDRCANTACSAVTLLLDGDKAGREATEKMKATAAGFFF